jgi:hypothetical protein
LPLLSEAIGRSRIDRIGFSTVGFNEDLSRVRERTAARNLALLREIRINLARVDTTLKASLKGKRKSDAWDDTFMATPIAG